MAGDYAPKFREVLGELPGELAKLGRAYRRCGEALSVFATRLAEVKSQAGNALRAGQDAHDTIQGAVRQVRATLPPDAAAVSQRQVVSSPLLEAAIAGLDEDVKAQVRPVARRAQFAEADRQRARRLATDAARLRGEAENTCADGVREALDGSGIKNKSWLEKAWDFVSAPFRSWDAFVDLCKTVAMIAGTVALFISGPIGLALVAVALVAGAAIFADSLAKFARGEASLGTLAMDALGLIPGARGVTSLAALGRSAAGLAGGVRTGGKAVLGGLRTAGSTIRSGISNVRRSAVESTKKILCRDPIDVATGDMVFQQTDVDLPAILPLTLRRTHTSSYRVGCWFGPSWASTLDQRLELDATGVCYAAEDGMLLLYPVPGQGPVLPEEGPRRPLTRTPDGGYTITEPDSGRTLHFAPVCTADALMLPLVGISDRNGQRITLDYNPAGSLVEVRHSGGYHIAVETNDGLITALRLRDGDNGSDVTLLRYSYDDARRLTEVINSSDLPMRFDYDPDGRITHWTDRNDTWYAYTYDEAGRCVRTTGTDGYFNGTISYHREDPDHASTQMTDLFGYSTWFRLNDAYQVVRETNPLDHTTVSEWDRYDRLLARTDPLGRTTRYTYDLAGNLVALTHPDGTQALAEYNTLHQPVTITDPDGAVWRQQYDQRGNLVALTDSAGATTTYTYIEGGHLTTLTDALGNTRRFTTNAAGLPVALTDPLGAVTRYDRDAFGRISVITDPVGVTRLGWTLEGQLAWRALPDGATEHWTYDGEGNLVEYLDALGQPTRLTYTPFDLPATRTGPDGARLEFGYDSELRLTTVTNPQGLTWRYDYDPGGNLIEEADYNGRPLTYRYDTAGQFVEHTNGAGQTIRYHRDLLGNITEQHCGDLVTTFGYDPAGRLTAATNPHADLTFERDPLGRVLAETCNGRTLTNTYDPLGRRLVRRTPTGAVTSWEYGPNHQPVALHTAGHTLRFTHDPAGREIERRIDTTVTLTQAWDVNHQLRSQTLTARRRGPAQPESAHDARLLQRRSYTYRPDGHLAGIDDHLAGNHRFTLDPTGRITTVHGPSWIEHYRYDPAGNITHATGPAVDAPTPHNPVPNAGDSGDYDYAGTLLRRAGNVRYQHDAQGRVVLRQHKTPSAKPRTWQYTWDAYDRLVAVTSPDGQRWRYEYEPLGRRIVKQRLTPDETTVIEQIDFIWDGLTLAEQTHTGPSCPDGRTTTWTWEPGTFRPLSQTERTPLRDAPQDWVDEQFYAIVTDLIGTPTELVDATGTLARPPQTTLWGVPVDPTPGDIDCPLRFPGQYHDPETALHYNYFRYYDPSTAHYQSHDPIGLPGGSNPSIYVPNPMTWIDPLGLAGCKTTASTDQVRTISGWGAPPPGYQRATPQQVLDLQQQIGHPVRRAGAMDQGVPGQYFASHAERQATVLHPNAPIEVSSPMCNDCQKFFQALAGDRQVPHVVTDPNGTRVFNPDGSVLGP